MTSAKSHHQHPSSSKPPKHPSASAAAAAAAHEPQIPNPNPNIVLATTNSPITMPQEDQILSLSTHLTRPEILRRRSHRLKQLSKCYRDHYWALMEDLRAQYREYYWRFGVSPFKEDQNRTSQRSRIGLGEETGDGDALEGSGEDAKYNGGNNCGKGDLDLKGNNRCTYFACKSKAMPLTRFCHQHILSDSKQRLYKACTYVTRTQAGSRTCGNPILRSTVPSWCDRDVQKAQKQFTRALKDVGLNVSSSRKLAGQFHVIVAEFVRHIKAQRRASLKDKLQNIVKEETATESGDHCV